MVNFFPGYWLAISLSNMRVGRNLFPLLITGFLASSILALYFVMVEKRALFSRGSFVEMLPTVPSKENGNFDFNFVHLAIVTCMKLEEVIFKNWCKTVE